MKTLLNIEKAIIKVEFILVAIILLSMCFLAFGQVIMRNFFSFSFVWADALVKISVLWVAILGASIATSEKGHIRIDLFSRILPEPYNEYLDACLSLVAAAVCLTFFRMSYDFVAVRYALGDIDFYMKLPQWVFASIFPIGFLIMTFKFVLRFIFDMDDVYHSRKGFHDEEDGDADSDADAAAEPEVEAEA